VLTRRIALVGTILTFTVGVGFAIWLDRAWARWWRMNRPFAGISQSRKEMMANQRRRWSIASDFTRGLGELTTELKRQQLG